MTDEDIANCVPRRFNYIRSPVATHHCASNMDRPCRSPFDSIAFACPDCRISEVLARLSYNSLREMFPFYLFSLKYSRDAQYSVRICAQSVSSRADRNPFSVVSAGSVKPESRLVLDSTLRAAVLSRCIKQALNKNATDIRTKFTSSRVRRSCGCSFCRGKYVASMRVSSSPPTGLQFAIRLLRCSRELLSSAGLQRVRPSHSDRSILSLTDDESFRLRQRSQHRT